MKEKLESIVIRNTKPLEYQMSREMFDALLEQRDAVERKQNPYTYVMDVINREFRLRGTVTKIFIYDDD